MISLEIDGATFFNSLFLSNILVLVLKYFSIKFKNELNYLLKITFGNFNQGF